MSAVSSLRTGVFLGAMVFLTSCTKKQTPGTVCPRAEAAFRLQISATRAPIPDGTRVEVNYQGSQSETFVAGQPTHNVDVCCRFGPRVTGALPHVSCETSENATAAVSTVRSALYADGSVVLDAGLLRDAAVLADASEPDGAAPPRDSGGSDSSVPSPDAGPTDRALQCELWTNGSASLRVSAPHFSSVTEDLVSKLRDDGCGVRTVEREIVLSETDGG